MHFRMKKKFNYQSLIFTTIICILMIAGCKDKDDPTPSNPTDTTDTEQPYNGPTGFLRLHLHNYIDQEEVLGPNEIYTNNAGRKISFSRTNLFISKIELIKKDGSVYKVPGKIILKNVDEDTYDIGDVPPGFYKSIRFYVGLDEETNKKSPSSATDVLSNQSMWYGSSAQPEGYAFINFEGKIDTTTNGDGSEGNMQPFSYKLGTSKNFKQVVMPEYEYAVIVNKTQFLHLYLDWNQFFRNVPLNNNANLNVSSIEVPAKDIETIIGNNIASMFKYEE